MEVSVISSSTNVVEVDINCMRMKDFVYSPLVYLAWACVFLFFVPHERWLVDS